MGTVWIEMLHMEQIPHRELPAQRFLHADSELASNNIKLTASEN